MLDKINAQLKAGCLGVRIEQIGARLYLVATLPPKPGSEKTKKHQQRISTGIRASTEGLSEVYGQALRLASDLLSGNFDWKDWDTSNGTVEGEKTPTLTLPSLAQEYREYWLRIYGDDVKREGTWRKDYHAVIQNLPADLPLEPEAIRKFILYQTEPNSRTRKKYCTVLGALAEFGKIQLNLNDIRGNYKGTRRKRILPSDEDILRIGMEIKHPGWRWIYGMLATFGLRDHEVFYVDHDYLASAGICHVLECKSYEGKVWPFYPEWLDIFDLRNVVLPKLKPKKLHIDYGEKVSKFFYRNRKKIPFNAYSLRHCWARRAISLGLDSRLAAKQMRHGHGIHVSTYNQWIGDELHQQEWERIRKILSEE